MKRLIALVLILFSSANLALAAETDYERKLEYKREKIDILLKTRTLGETSGYATSDNWSTTISPEAGYSYTYSTGTTRTGSTVQFREISDWVIIRGGIRELSDLEFLTITGNSDKAREIQAKLDEADKWRMIGTITGLIGLGVAIAGASNSQVGTITVGSVISLIGFTISSFNFPRKHYIYADYALEERDKYNIRIKKELGLPIDFE